MNLSQLYISEKGQGLYSQHFIFFVTYELAQWARLLHKNKLERLAGDKHSDLLGFLARCEENEVLWIWLQEPIQKAELWPYSRY